MHDFNWRDNNTQFGLMANFSTLNSKMFHHSIREGPYTGGATTDTDIAIIEGARITKGLSPLKVKLRKIPKSAYFSYKSVGSNIYWYSLRKNVKLC